MKMRFIFTHRQPGHLFKLVAQVLHAAVAHLEGYLTKGKLIIAYQFLDLFHFDQDDVLLQGGAGPLGKEFAEIGIGMAQSFTEVVGVANQGVGIVAVKNELDDGRLDFLNQALGVIVDQFESVLLQQLVDELKTDDVGIKPDIGLSKFNACHFNKPRALQRLPDDADAACANHVLDMERVPGRIKVVTLHPKGFQCPFSPAAGFPAANFCSR
jgi:hypothetical protein